MKPLTAVPLEDAALTVEELAHACSVQMTWVVERVQSGLLGAVTTTTTTLSRTTTVGTATPAQRPAASSASVPIPASPAPVGAPTGASASAAPPELRFHSPDLLRARRLAALERSFDADPELAALAVDLIEEVERLRRRLRAIAGQPG